VELLKNGLVHVIASDAHSAERPPVLSQAIAEAVKIMGEEKAKVLVQDNPENIIKASSSSANVRLTERSDVSRYI
jgi:tyrosine-protein phosphatase YwqE